MRNLIQPVQSFLDRVEVRQFKGRLGLLGVLHGAFLIHHKGCARAHAAHADEVIEQIQEVAVVPLLHPEIFLRGGKPPIRGVLLHGEPGTGKSLLARALAREPQATFHSISAPEIIGGCAGASEAARRELFSEARQDAPSVVFIDEIDAIAPDRQTATERSKRLVAQLLTLLDGMEERGRVVVIGATNRLGDIDPAVN